MKVRFPRPMGRVSARIHGAQRILAERANSCRTAARSADPDSQHAAALRGKAKGFDEARALLVQIEDGRPFRSRRWFQPKGQPQTFADDGT